MCPPALYCCVRLCLAILYVRLPALGCCGRLCLGILCLPALDVASSSFDFEKHKLFGVYGGVIVSGLVPLVVGHCVRLVSLLFPFVSLLVGHCVHLVPSVSLCLRSCLPSVSFCLPPCCPCCLLSVSFCLWSCFPSCWALCPSCLPCVSFCLPSCLPCCPPSCWSLCPPCLPSFLYMCLLSPPLACNPSRLSPSCSALQSFTFVSLCLHLSPSSGLLCPPLPCFVSQLWAAVSASALQSFTFVS